MSHTVVLSPFERALNILNELSPKHDRIISDALDDLRRQRDDAVARAEKAEAQRIAFGGALAKAEAALADIGDADREPGDDLAWCERRAAEALPFVRRALGLGERGEK